MPKSIGLALLAALLSGLAIGTQASLNSAAGKLTGAALTGLLVNFLGGAAAGLVLLAVGLQRGAGALAGIRLTTWGILIVSGLLGIGIITGIAYALPRTGVAAGLSAIIAGQMLVALLVDALGLAGGQPIQLTWGRLLGLALLMLGTWAILPKG